MGTTRERLEELNLTREELERLGEAFKKKEFCDLLTQYVEETQNPENVKLYQQEVTQLEKQRGVDVTFINPVPGYVIKTSVDGSRKCFVNICCNENISRPVSQPGMEDGTRGLNWSLPHSLSPPREDIDRNRQRCQVFDVVFHPDTLHLASKNKAFAGMVNESACDAIESNFNVKLDRKNLKFPKLKYKGTPHACVIRKPSKEKPVECPAEDKEFFDNLYAHMGDIPTNTNTSTSPGATSDRRLKKVARKDSNKPDKCIYTTPKFEIKHRTQVELQDFTLIKDVRNVTRPKELVVEINLPLLKSANNISIDVTEKTLQLLSEKPAKYKLNLNLPYPVNQDAGVAKFDKDTKKLTIVLQVKTAYISCPDVNAHSDSGVELESDQGSPSSPEEVDDLIDGVLRKNSHEIPDPGLSDCAIYSPGFRTHILDDSVHYTLPEFTCHVYNNTVAFTLQVKNVNEDSVRKLCNGNSSSVQVAFQSISSSFYAMYYAFYVRLPDHKIQDDDVSIETWDNNVILQITFEKNNIDLTSYYVGISEGNTTLKYIQEASLINSVLEQSTLEELIQDEQEYKTDNPDITSYNDNNFEDESSSQENEEKTINNAPRSENNQNHVGVGVGPGAGAGAGAGAGGETEGRVSMDIVSVSYESSGDELSCSYSPSKGKGILKRLSKKQFSRSISESSLDDFAFSSSFECHASVDSGIPEEDAEASRSFKKTVRFNDVVSRQLYRCNSSILGQRKKNQRKAKNKKKAQVRRASESDTSEVDDKKERELKTQSDEGNKELEREGPGNNDTDIFHFDFDT